MSEIGEGFQPQPTIIETVKTEPKTEIIEKAQRIVSQVGIDTNIARQKDQDSTNVVDQNLKRFKGDYNATTSQPGPQELKYKVEPVIRDIDQKIVLIKSMVNNFGSDQISVQGRLENILKQISNIDDLNQVKDLVNEANQVFKSNVDKLSNDRDQSRIVKNRLNDSAHQNEMTIRQIINNKQYDSSFKPGSSSQALLERCQISSRFLANQIDSVVQTSNQTDFSFKNNIHENQQQFTNILQSLIQSKN